MAGSAFSLEGEKLLLKRLKELETKLAVNTLVAAAKAGAQPILERASMLAPVETGTLSAGLQLLTTARKKRLYGEVSVTHRKEAAHAILQEYGVDPHWQPKRKRHHPGHAPQPFFRPAYDQLKDSSAAIVIRRLKNALMEVAR